MSDPGTPLTVNQAIAKLQHLAKQGHDDLFLQTTTPCGLKTLVSDLVTGPADFGLLVEVR
jgi:hypothetical protein